MPTTGLLSVGCLLVTVLVVVVAVPGVAAAWPFVSPSDNDVYPVEPPPPRPGFSKSRVRNMSETMDLREFIMNYVQDERICSDPTLQDLILAEDGGDERAKVWWSRRCGGRRGGRVSRLPTQSPESTLIRYRRKSSNRDNPQNSLPRSQNDDKKWNKIRKLMKDKRIKCKPKKMSVPLPNPDSYTTQLQPECVYIKRCGGCCNSPQLECVASRTKTRTFPTMELTTVAAGYTFSNNRKIKMVKLEEHTACTCECKVRPEHCTSSQVYNEDACQCQCPSHLSRSCPPKKTWNEMSCQCECANPTNCTTGRYFDVNSCRCADPLRV